MVRQLNMFLSIKHVFKGDVANLKQSTFIKEACCKVPCCMDIKEWIFFFSWLSYALTHFKYIQSDSQFI